MGDLKNCDAIKYLEKIEFGEKDQMVIDDLKICIYNLQLECRWGVSVPTSKSLFNKNQIEEVVF